MQAGYWNNMEEQLPSTKINLYLFCATIYFKITHIVTEWLECYIDKEILSVLNCQ